MEVFTLYFFYNTESQLNLANFLDTDKQKKTVSCQVKTYLYKSSKSIKYETEKN